MVDTTGRYVITFNGEIYNFRELRSTLERLGHRFRSTGDTEVLLEAYKEWGSQLVERITGIYAFAIWDDERRALFLARDPLGVKPLFYSVSGGTFRFGSEVKAVLQDPEVDRAFNPTALDAFLTFGYTPAPLTGFSSISQLLPGHLAWVSRKGFQCCKFSRPPYVEHSSEKAFDEALEEFEVSLDRVTASQMVSDVGIGAFLSGGLDSAAIVRSMTRAEKAPVQAFGIGLDYSGFNELDRARSSAKALGVEFSGRVVGVEDADILVRLSRHLEEPMADSSCLPTFLLCREAVQQFKVAMSGDGADEILAGYGTYTATLVANYYRKLPRLLRRRILGRLVGLIPSSDKKYPLRDIAGRFVYGVELGPGLDHCAWRIIFDDPLKQRLYQSEFRNATSCYSPLKLYAKHLEEVPASRGALSGLLHADASFYLPNDMLVKVDRMSMANGLEVRVPFLDESVVRFCAALPSRYKLKHGYVRKHILRESLRGVLPDSTLRAPKSGFNMPVEQWMRGYLRELLFDYLDTARDDLSSFLRVDEVIRMADQHLRNRLQAGHALFVILMFCMWLDNASRQWKS